MTENTEALIAEARREASIHDKLGDGFSEGSEERAFYYGHRDRYKRLADALETANTERDAVPDAATEGESLFKVMDTLAYYHCRSVNPKADHPRMGYHAMTVDQREHLREKQREAAEEIMRMIPSLSRAAAPDAATEQAKQELAACLELRAYWRNQTVKARAERDAALAAVERVRAIHVRDTPSIGGDWCLDDHHKWPCPTVAALDGAPEPEWELEYRVTLKNGTELARGTLDEVHRFKTIDIERRRKAGPWLPVEGEKP